MFSKFPKETKEGNEKFITYLSRLKESFGNGFPTKCTNHVLGVQGLNVGSVGSKERKETQLGPVLVL